MQVQLRRALVDLRRRRRTGTAWSRLSSAASSFSCSASTCGHAGGRRAVRLERPHLQRRQPRIEPRAAAHREDVVDHFRGRVVQLVLDGERLLDRRLRLRRSDRRRRRSALRVSSAALRAFSCSWTERSWFTEIGELRDVVADADGERRLRVEIGLRQIAARIRQRPSAARSASCRRPSASRCRRRAARAARCADRRCRCVRS